MFTCKILNCIRISKQNLKKLVCLSSHLSHHTAVMYRVCLNSLKTFSMQRLWFDDFIEFYQNFDEWGSRSSTSLNLPNTFSLICLIIYLVGLSSRQLTRGWFSVTGVSSLYKLIWRSYFDGSLYPKKNKCSYGIREEKYYFL